LLYVFYDACFNPHRYLLDILLEDLFAKVLV